MALTRVELNLNFEFESAHELWMNSNFVFSNSLNLNFVFSKSMNLNLNLIFSKLMNLNLYFVFSTSMNLNILIKHSTNFEFFHLNLTKQTRQFVTGLYQLMLQTFHKIYQANRKFMMANMTLQGALKLFLSTVISLVHLLENELYTHCWYFISLKVFIAF